MSDAESATQGTHHLSGLSLHAFVKPFARNVLEIYCWPEAHIVDLAVILKRSGLETNPVGIDVNGVPNALLTFSETDYVPDDIERYVTVLSRAGVQCHGYELVHEHDLIDIDLFRRIGSANHDPDAEAPLFVVLQRLDQIDERGHLLVFGAPDRLEQFVATSEHMVDSIDPAMGPHGVDSVIVQFGYEVSARTGELLRALEAKGVPIHFRSFNPRES